ncbi:MAG: glucose-6-phosphate isomerase family protein, partial [Armatimonadota bacterium]
RSVLMDATADGPAILYRMYRNMGVADAEKREQAQAARLRYDITVLRHGRLGDELLKTSGHFHPPTPGAPQLSFPETYECVRGTALFLMQKVANASDIYAPAGQVRIVDVILAEVHAGERVIMPPNYGHVMINPTHAVTVTSDWVCGDFDSYYEPYEAHRGAAYYVLPGSDGGVELTPNEAYGDVPECRRARPKQDIPELGLRPDTPLFAAFYAAPDKFGYLCEPGTAAEALAAENLFDFP